MELPDSTLMAKLRGSLDVAAGKESSGNCSHEHRNSLCYKLHVIYELKLTSLLSDAS